MLLLIVWVITAVDIFRRKLGGKLTAIWLVVVILVPFIGAIAYWAMRKPTQEEIDRAVSGESVSREAGSTIHRR